MKLPLGFQASGVCAGIKPSGNLDLGVIYSPHPLYWALTTTQNSLKAPCVARNLARFRSNQPVNGIIVNSGNANCATGEQGTWDNEDFAGIGANILSLAKVQDILTASTGVIGEYLPIDKIRAALPRNVSELENDSNAFAEAILTTDTLSKQVAVTMDGGARIVGIAKGSGMVHPNMATMLAFVMTDAAVPQNSLRALWKDVVNTSFNQVSIDGDTSPNDMAFLFSSHQVQVSPPAFTTALKAICERLSQKIAQDGEGATRLISVHVSGARNDKEARLAAKAIAKSSLIKTAVHGGDPNWGRILSALGASEALLDFASVLISIQNTIVYRGGPVPFDRNSLAEKMQADEITINIDLSAGEGSGTAWGCDLTAEYVHINADYTT